MYQIDNLIKQYQELLKLIESISNLLKMQHIIQNAQTVRLLLSTLTRKLKTYLMAEDEVLAVVLFRHEEPEVESMIYEFIEEMDKIEYTFNNYIQKWLKEASTPYNYNQSSFIKESYDIFNILSRKVTIEDKILPVLHEKISQAESFLENQTRKISHKTSMSLRGTTK